MRRVYVPKKFGERSMQIIRVANQICEQYAAQGYDLTLRQLYYQFVARGYLDNKQSEYKRLGQIVNDARLAGYIDWDHIVDRTRNLRGWNYQDSPKQAVREAANRFLMDKWKDQPYRMEVWVEKDALIGVLDVACAQVQVPYFSCRGYTSQSEIWEASQRVRKYLQAGQKVTILHLGDHDPSGLDMTRDMIDRMSLFIAIDLYHEGYSQHDAVRMANDDFRILRIALNMDQVEEYNPPPNPAKLTDSRAEGYIERYGDESWELDALDPATLSELIIEEVESYRDGQRWDRSLDVEARHKATLKRISEKWTDVERMVNSG